VEDPASGLRPSFDGAFDVAGGEEKANSRRGRRRRNGKKRSASLAETSAQPAQDGGNRRPETVDPSDPPRKRKRRRKKNAARADATAKAPVTAEAKAPRVGDDRPYPDDKPGDTRHPGKKKRNRRRRSPQGRLIPGQREARPIRQNVAAPASEPVREARPQTANRDQASHRPQPQYHDDLYAALDLGTNNCRLLIAQPTRPGQFRVVDAFSRIVRLGEGLGASGRLSAEAMDRSVEALKICAAKLESRNIRKRRLIATEACRAAENGEEFLARVAVEAGLQLEIINRETEARLAVSGCSSLVGRDVSSVVLFDIGGGSSEIAVIKTGEYRSSRLANHITHWTSLPVGVVTLSERHGGRDVTPDIFEAMIAEVEGMLSKFDSPDVAELAGRPGDGFHLIGTSGTVTTLAGIHLGLPKYDRRKVDGLWLTDQEVSSMQAKLLSWDFAGRAANPCIGPDRADLVLAGCAILEAIRRRWPSERMRVADRGLREGLLTDMMADDGVWRRMRYRNNNISRRPDAGDKATDKGREQE
jgi:exopolyphosphatase / guanosine-5'-triphosphate,3'-diphosphate pyrophosphatase